MDLGAMFRGGALLLAIVIVMSAHTGNLIIAGSSSLPNAYQMWWILLALAFAFYAEADSPQPMILEGPAEGSRAYASVQGVFDVSDVSDESHQADSPICSGTDEDTCDDELQLPMSADDSTDEDVGIQLPSEASGCQPPSSSELRLGCQPPGMQLDRGGNVPLLRAPGSCNWALGWQILRELPRSQFVVPSGERWPNLDVSGVLDMWSGCKRFAHYCVQHGAPWVLTYDCQDDAVRQDLMATSPI